MSATSSSVLATAAGTLDAEAADHILVGEVDDDWAGTSVAGAGDLDGDGLGDVIVGAPINDAMSDNSGTAYVVLGATMAAESTLDLGLADAQFLGQATNDQVGNSVSL